MSKKTLAELEQELQEANEKAKVLEEQLQEQNEILSTVKIQKEETEKELELLKSNVITKKITTKIDGYHVEIISDVSIPVGGEIKTYSKEELADKKNADVLKGLMKIGSGTLKILEAPKEEEEK